MELVRQSELEALLDQLARDETVDLGVGDPPGRGWFRASVVSHDTLAGRLVLTCYMDRPTDRALEPGERVVVAAHRAEEGEQLAPMDVEYCGTGAQPQVRLRTVGAWQTADERRHQLRVPLDLATSRARRWTAGAWHDLAATVIDLSSRGVGLRLDQPVQVGDRLSLLIALDTGTPELRVTVEIRHVRADAASGQWHAGGLFRNLAPIDHERVIRFIFGELRVGEKL